MKSTPKSGTLTKQRLDNISKHLKLILNTVIAPVFSANVNDFSQLETVEGKGYLAKGSVNLYNLDNAYLGKLSIIALRPGEGTGVVENVEGKRIPGMFTTVNNSSVVIPRNKNKETPIPFKEYFIPLGTFKYDNTYSINSFWMSGYEKNNPENRISFIKNLGLEPKNYVPLINKNNKVKIFPDKLDFTLDTPSNPLKKDSWMKRFGAYHSVVVPTYYPQAVQVAGFFQINADNFELMTESGIITYKNEAWKEAKHIRSLDELN